MPSFHSMSGQAPMTPPEFVPATAYEHGFATAQYPQDHFLGHQSMHQRQDTGLDYSRLDFRPQAQLAPVYQHNAYQNAPSLPPISSYYEPIGAPILPPLRNPDAYAVEEEYRLRTQQDRRSHVPQQQQIQQQPQAAVKEEKATGGVSAKLDYEMERMTDFVSEAAQGIIKPGPIQPPFRKWVSQVLSATRLPSATILLSLHYLTVRIRDFPESIVPSDNQIYRLLAVSMVLGSKFLDDNTFINRSWSDVSGIKVSELNALEKEWLSLINFDLHCDPTDENGFALWLRAWTAYKSQAVSKARPARLSPLETSTHRQSPHRSDNSPHPSQRFSKEVHGQFTPLSSRPASSTYAGTPYVSADPWNPVEPRPMQSFYNSQHRYPTLIELDHANRLASMDQSRNNASAYTHAALPPLHSFAPTCYASPWNQPAWGTSHTHGCNCMMCFRQYPVYAMAPNYSQQTVVG